MTACSQGAADPSASNSTPSASVSIPPSNAEALASVKVEDQGKGKAPKVTFDKPLAIKAESMALVTPGDGAQVKEGQVVEFREIALNTETGETVGENFTKDAGGTVVLNDAFKQQFPLVYTTFANAKIGAFIAYGTPAVEGSTAAPSQAATSASMSVFQVMTATDAPPAPKLMSADDVAKLAKEGKLPTAKFDDKGVPSITIPKVDAPVDLAVQVLTEGTGDVVAATDSISALYTGWTWSDSKQFDSAYDRGEAATFGLQQVIQGWTMGLAGQKVGSTVLLTIPTDLAYGAQAAASGKPAGPLVFVVKIESKK